MLASFALWSWPRVLHLGRLAAIGAASGLMAGALVGGLGGRVAMRISAMAGDEAIQGQLTTNENIVGQITLDGSLALIFFGALFPGLIGGLLYVAVRRWLPGPQRWQGLAYGILLLLVLGSMIIESDNQDFVRFGPPLLNVLLFASLFPLFGLTIAPLANWLDRTFPPGTTARLGKAALLYPIMAIPPLLFVLVAGFGLAAIPFAAVPLVIGLALAALAREFDGSLPLPSSDRVGKATFLYPLLSLLFLFPLIPSIGGVLEASELHQRLVSAGFLMLYTLGLAPTTERSESSLLPAPKGPLAMIVGYAFLGLAPVIGLFLTVTSVSEILAGR
ncbi:MAG: hypothetical protein EXR50_05980 [Dehalococcoidia bacterium]|nr:hypothetical protein [Dehalococcoidia bacterium]